MPKIPAEGTDWARMVHTKHWRLTVKPREGHAGLLSVVLNFPDADGMPYEHWDYTFRSSDVLADDWMEEPGDD